MRILFKYATRGRPKWFKETLEKYYSMLSGKHDYLFIVSMDTDDDTMNNGEMWNYLDSKKDLTYHYGDHKTKIQAINSGMPAPDIEYDILVLISDDMTPTVQGFDDRIAGDMKKYFPALDGALHYHDGKSGKALLTISIMGSELYHQLGYIYYPAYKSLWCDNEFMDVANELGKCQYIDETIIQHNWQKHGSDEIYQKSESCYIDDQATYKARKEKGFPQKYSQNNEDDVIRSFFKDVCSGKFLDIGAGDGYTFSNTKFLYDTGWTGVAIEPSPTLFENLKKNCQNGRIKMIKKALSGNNENLTFYHAPNDFVSTSEDEHKKKWSHVINYETISVEAITWQELGEMGPYDFINLDIEGNNIKMLEKMPSEILKGVRLVCIEHDNRDDFVRSFFRPFGFTQLMMNGENIILGRFDEEPKEVGTVVVCGHTVLDITADEGNGNVLDIGSRNYGFSNYFADKGFKCVAVEPDANIILTGNKTIATIIGVAIVSRANNGKKGTLIKWSTGEGNHLKRIHGDIPEDSIEQEVNCISIDKITGNIPDAWDIVKLDCEGAEYEILLDWPGPIARQITVEFHDFAGANPNPDNEETHRQIIEHLSQWYDVYQHEKSVRGGCSIPNYWDSLFVLKG